MKLSDVVPSRDLLNLAQGVEADLVKRKRTGSISAMVALAWAVIQVLLAAQSSYLGNIGVFVANLLSGNWDRLFGPEGITYPEFVGLLVLAGGFGSYFLLNWTSFLMKETEDPFRYSFWIEPFTLVGASEKDNPIKLNHIQMALLHRDLMERLNQRIQRLSLLDGKSLESAGSSATALKSHIHIRGDYAIREERAGEWIIHVMPRIRIGPVGKPETPAHAVRYPLMPVNEQTCTVDVESYRRIVERVYSRVATEIYRQIELDVQEKIELFPTSYLRAVALYREAQDLARSNTIDAYDHAISLYRQSLRYFNVANISPLTNLFLKMPLLWRFETKFVHVQAMVQLGYAQSLIYRRTVSAYSGRYRNPLFEISGELSGVILRLTQLHNKMSPKWRLVPPNDADSNTTAPDSVKRNRLNTLMAMFTFHRDSWITPLSPRPSEALFQRQTKILFDCYVVAALTHYSLGSTQRATRYLGDAEAAGPGLSETNALYLLVAGEIESDREKAILLFRRATEVSSNFEIAQYALAKNMEILFRKQDEFSKERARVVMREYDEVLAINPGNLAALVCQGYLLWLLGDVARAKDKFEDGRENKAIVRETFIGELHYGLARIAAEQGRFGASYDFYTQAIAADPGVGAYSESAGRVATTQYYECIGPAMLARYTLFKETVENKISKLLAASAGGKLKDEAAEEISERVLNVVYSLVLNDYGNANLNYFGETGDLSKLDEAIRAFEVARDKDPDSKIVPYNLHTGYLWRDKPEDRIRAKDCLESAEKLGPSWPISVFALAQAHLRHTQGNMKKAMAEAEQRVIVEDKDRERQPARADDAPQMVQSKYESAQSLFEKAMRQLDELTGVLPEVQKIMETTKLSSIYQGFNFDIEGGGVDQLLSARINPDRLDENDVRALRLWAEVLSNNFRSERALNAAESICSYIRDHYYPEHFDAILIPRDMYLTRKREYVLRSSLTAESMERAEHDKAVAESTQKLKTYTDRLKPVVKDWVERNPTDYRALTWVDEVFKDDPPAAIEIFERAARLGPANAWHWNTLGVLYYSAEDYVRSAESFEKARNLAPTMAVYQANLGNARNLLKQFTDAAAAYLKALEHDPNNATYWNSLGNTFYSTENYAQSIEQYKKAIELDGVTAVYHANLGGAAYKLSQWGIAEAAYIRALELEPKNPDYWNSLGATRYMNEQYETAMEGYRKAIELVPSAAVYHFNLGNAWYKLKKWEEARTSFMTARDLDPENSDYWNYLGTTYYFNTKYGLSIDMFKKAIELKSGVAVYHVNLGNALTELEQWKAAEVSYLKALDIEPNNAMSWNSLGNARYATGDFQRAAECYRKAIDLSPATDVFKNNLELALKNGTAGAGSQAAAAGRT